MHRGLTVRVSSLLHDVDHLEELLVLHVGGHVRRDLHLALLVLRRPVQPRVLRDRRPALVLPRQQAAANTCSSWGCLAGCGHVNVSVFVNGRCADFEAKENFPLFPILFVGGSWSSHWIHPPIGSRPGPPQKTRVHSYLPCPRSYLPCPHSCLPCPHSYLPCPHSCLPCPHSCLPYPHSPLTP